jgi:hypothetical protein
MPENGIGYGPFATDIDRVDQQFVVVTATADQVYEVGAGNRALAFEFINQVLVEKLNYAWAAKEGAEVIWESGARPKGRESAIQNASEALAGMVDRVDIAYAGTNSFESARLR